MTHLDLDTHDPAPADWRIVVDSIGDAGASLLTALKRVSPLPESHLAALLYQAPSVLAQGLERETAEAVNGVLCEAGLESRVIDREAAFKSGDSSHELALVVRDARCMGEVVKLVIQVLGVSAPTARRLLCTSPTVLVGRVSASTAGALKRRFEALSTEVIVSRAEESLFDVFLGACSANERLRAAQALRALGVELPAQAAGSADETPAAPLVAAGLTKAEADRMWERLARTNLPIRVINRDFERFDVVLHQAPESPEMIGFLVETTGMPEAVAHKVVRRTPIVTHQDIAFGDMGTTLEQIHRLGGKATADLLAFQGFALVLSQVGDLEMSSTVLQALAGLDPAAALAALSETHRVDGPLTPPQARWLQAELERAGTTAKRVLR